MNRARTFLLPTLGVLTVGAGLSVVGMRYSPVGQAIAYLAAFGFVASSVIGGLALLAMMDVVGARWFVVLRRLCLGLAAPAVILPVLFLPIALNLRSIYPWAGSPLAGAEAFAAAHRAQVFGCPWMSWGPIYCAPRHTSSSGS